MPLAIARTPENAIRLAIFWLGFFALLAGLLAAKFGPAPVAQAEQPNISSISQ
jgi:hypothetical protein